jgi:glycosyltransferase involved in cell wall biosynthesis
MRIGMDLSPVRTIGTIVHSQGFLPAFIDQMDSGDSLTVFGPDTLNSIMRPLLSTQVRFAGKEFLASVPTRICWQQFILPGLVLKEAFDVFLSPFGIAPGTQHCPAVVGITNPQPIVDRNGDAGSGLLSDMKNSLFGALVRRSCRNAAQVVFPSRYAANVIGDLLDVPPLKRSVIYHGLDNEFWEENSSPDSGLSDSAIPSGKYILFASKFYPQKRAALLVDAFSRWRTGFGRTDYQLVFCGEPAGSDAAKAVLQRAVELGLEKDVQMLGIVDRAILRQLYRHASQFVMPTVLETFGFPYVEAMATGTPLVCADIEIARELCGDAAYYFRPDDIEDLAAAMERAAGDPERARKLARGRERARSFSWGREAAETLDCLRAAAGLPTKGLNAALNR